MLIYAVLGREKCHTFFNRKTVQKMNPVAPDPPLERVQQKKVGKELTRTERQMIIFGCCGLSKKGMGTCV